MWKLVLLSLCLSIPTVAAEKMSAPQLIDLAKSNHTGLHDAVTGTFE